MSLTSKIGKSVQLTLPTVGSKDAQVVVSVKTPNGATFKISTSKVSKNKAYTVPAVKFATSGKYVFTLSYGTSKKTITVNVSN